MVGSSPSWDVDGRSEEDQERGETPTASMGDGLYGRTKLSPHPPHLQGWGHRGGTGPGAEATEQQERRGNNDAVADVLRASWLTRPPPFLSRARAAATGPGKRNAIPRENKKQLGMRGGGGEFEDKPVALRTFKRAFPTQTMVMSTAVKSPR